MPEYPLWNPATQRPSLGHYVYRFFGASGDLLYIGSSGNLWYRIGQHAASRKWWPEVAWERTVAELISGAECAGRGCTLPAHAEMLRYEVRLIADQRPRYNQLMSGYCRSGRHLLADYGVPAGGRRGITCGACRSEAGHRHYVANRADRLAYQSTYYQANREKILESKRRARKKAQAAL